MAVHKQRDEDIKQMSWHSNIVSEEKYHRLERISSDRRYEYIYGKIYMMSGGTVEHDRIRRNIETTLERKLESGPCTVFGVDVQVLLGQKKNNRPHYVYPDTTVSCNSADWTRGNTLIKSPRVVVEVLSESTEEKDRGVKFKAYQNCPTVQEIMFVSQFFPQVEVWQRDQEQPENPAAWQRRISRVDQPVKLASLGLQLEMSEMYRNINFELSEDDKEDIGQAEE